MDPSFNAVKYPVTLLEVSRLVFYMVKFKGSQTSKCVSKEASFGHIWRLLSIGQLQTPQDKAKHKAGNC